MRLENRSNSIFLSLIAPTNYLRHFVTQDPPGVLYLAAQRVLNEPDYRAFFCREKERGAYLIVDNGVYDLGSPLGVDDLLRAIQEISADELILPDIIHNGRATVALSTKAAIRVARSGKQVRMCAVVQGRDDDDWRLCYDSFVRMPYVDSIALPAPKKGHGFGLAFDRPSAAVYLEQGNLILAARTYRLLGVGDSGHIELEHLRAHSWIHSADSSAPVVHGALGLEIRRHETYFKSNIQIETIRKISPGRMGLIYRNITVFRAAAGCPCKTREHLSILPSEDHLS